MRLFLWLGLISLCISADAQVDPDYVLISNGWVDPVALENAGDGSGRLFVVEKQGLIWILSDPATGAYLSVPFLDIKSKVTNGGEKGLLGMAFHPEFPSQPYFYVNYTTTLSGQLHTRIERYSVITDPNKAMSGSGKVILEFSQPYGNHNAGDLAFGPDGYLYISTGDGGSGGDPDGFTQDYSNLLGNILRIDVNSDDFPDDANKYYAIPDDNPFVNNEAVRSELWSLGLRNPWRISFDQANGDLYIADVGQNQWEEVNRQPANSLGGEHYGWSCREGAHTKDFNPCTTDDLVDPFFEYDHGEGVSITGGFVYRGAVFPEFQGKYFCSDYGSRQLWMVDPTDGSSQKFDMMDFGSVSTFGQSESGELFLATMQPGTANGNIYRLINKAVCPDRLLVEVIDQMKYVAEGTIEATAAIAGDNQVEMEAGEEVSLLPEFSVEDPASLEVIMQSCIGQLIEQD